MEKFDAKQQIERGKEREREKVSTGDEKERNNINDTSKIT